jgi:hypothetical protein
MDRKYEDILQTLHTEPRPTPGGRGTWDARNVVNRREFRGTDGNEALQGIYQRISQHVYDPPSHRGSELNHTYAEHQDPTAY